MDERPDPIDRIALGIDSTPLGRAFDWTFAFLFAQAAWVFAGVLVIISNPNKAIFIAPFAVFWIVGMVLVLNSDEMRKRLLAGSLILGFMSIIPCLPIGMGMFVKMQFLSTTRHWDSLFRELFDASLIANINALLILIIGQAFVVIRRKRETAIRLGDR